jgi:rod shape-determining protein MreC
MRRWLGKRSTLIALAVLILILTQFRFFNPVRDALRTVISGPAHAVSAVGARAKSAFAVLFTVHDLARENTQLKEQLIAKEAEIAKLQFAQGENEQLKKDLQFRLSRSDFNVVAANVLNYSPTNIYQTITINRGSADGIAVGQAVVSAGFLVGKIQAVSEKTAEVWLLNNRNLLTPVMLTESQTVGLLKGSIRGLVVENIPLDTKVDKGTAVVTSALEGLYPAGIAVGVVEEVISAKEEIFLTLRISSPVNPSNLTSVLVISQ